MAEVIVGHHGTPFSPFNQIVDNTLQNGEKRVVSITMCTHVTTQACMNGIGIVEVI